MSYGMSIVRSWGEIEFVMMAMCVYVGYVTYHQVGINITSQQIDADMM